MQDDKADLCKDYKYSAGNDWSNGDFFVFPCFIFWYYQPE